MLALEIEFLTGRYTATAYNDRDQAEWPPHPARFFSALIATWAGGEPISAEGESELQVLRWLERQEAPEIVASPMSEVAVRNVLPTFVPVNDTSIISAPDGTKLALAKAALLQTIDAKARSKAQKNCDKLQAKLVADTIKVTAAPTKITNSDAKAARHLFPESRLRQPRTFPSLTPSLPTVIFAWPAAVPTPEQERTLERLLRRIVRLGHSSSFVRARVMEGSAVTALEAQAARFVVDPDDGELLLRWVVPGQIERLATMFARHRETESRVLPTTFVRYREGRAARPPVIESSLFGTDWVVFARVDGPRLPSTAAAGVATQMRRALMSFAKQPVSELISGHQTNGAASAIPHLAIVPLPFVGSAYSDGALLGIALILPRSTDPTDREHLIHAVGRFEAEHLASGNDETPIIQLHLGRAGTWNLQRIAWGEHKNKGLQPGTWSRPSKRWATATPVALDRNPGDLHDPNPAKRRAAFDAATSDVIEAVRRLGLPAPAQVDVVRSCVLAGTEKPRQFPRFPGNSERPQRVLVHLRLVFSAPVRGPILIGAGRYHGLGLCRPVDEERLERL